MSGDDLDDGLDYELQVSDSESLPESTELTDNEVETESSKRTRTSSQLDHVEPDQIVSKRQKKLAKSKVHQKKLEKVEDDKNQKKALPKSSPERIADYLATLIRQKFPDLSALELEEHYFKRTDFISTEAYEKERNLHNFQEFVNKFSKSPRAVILSPSNIRVADVFRSLGGSQSAVKLFTKSKLKDDVARVDLLLKSPKPKGVKTKKAQKDKKGALVKYFISTPTRLEKIASSTDSFFEGKDKLDIFLDASYLDPKANTLFTSEDSGALFAVLKEFLNKKSSVKILLF
ncbi:LADA_0D10726g1_1 [Lachancea dasiensis]|uniref:LADA_0D10726g1_1 n=1 Tax=Lachancea dasiensis TaxID=1072105 RepID=A0A1G4J8D1_9SACH|nr:LADA_0D10726g1_1 [Lachancea dasiensis]